MNPISQPLPSTTDSFLLQPISQETGPLVTKIQKTVRGFLARKSFLPQSLYPEYVRQCKSLSTSTPLATEGKAKVYLPTDMQEIVIKEIGETLSKQRFAQSEAIRVVVRELGLDQLKIPRSRIYDKYLIEERFSISTDPGYNATFYLSHPELFDGLARQMTRLFKKAYIDYLVEKNKDDDHLIRIRYDNIPFLMHQKEGKICIGLIDLERSSVEERIKSIHHKLFILASIFPLHSTLIEEEAEKSSMPVGMPEKQKIEKAVFYAKYYMEKMARNYLETQPLPPISITYPDISERRFGDALITYLHAKWIAFQYNLPLFYRNFLYSHELVLDDLEMRYNQEILKDCKEVKYRKGLEIPRASEEAPTLYSIHYFPECNWELQHGTRHNQKPWVDFFTVDWKNTSFRKEIQRLIRPKKILSKLSLPEDKICIAIHYREGGGYDHDIQSLNLPLKFPPAQFYLEGIVKISQVFQGAPLFCYLFTDALDPGKCVEELKQALPSTIPIYMDCRLHGNSHDQNVLEDFFSLFQFDALIYPQSNFSMIPALICDYAATYTIVSATQTESGVNVEETDLRIDEKRLKETFERLGK